MENKEGGAERPTILFFGNDWFADNRTSSHHLARQFSKYFRVFYVDSPGIRNMKGSKRDLIRMVKKVMRFLRGAEEVAPNLKVVTFLQVPLHGIPWVSRLNQVFLRLTARWLMWKEGIRDPIAWFHLPHMATLLGTLGECLSVYYCTDDHQAYPGVNAERIRQMDGLLCRNVDLLFCVSEPLLAKKRQFNPTAMLSPHGVDVHHFQLAQSPTTKIPEEISSISAPIVGYFGLVGGWLALDLLKYLAEQRPQWNFVLIGRVTDPERTPTAKNLHFLGSRPYSELPRYGKAFSVAIIPYAFESDWTYYANPLKLKEYLALGKPVVATSTPEIDKYADVVEIAKSPEEFLQAIDKVLSREDTEQRIQTRLSKVSSQSWEARAELLKQTLLARISQSPERVTSRIRR